MTNRNDLVVKEGVEGTYHYHLAPKHLWVSLCGRRVMQTSIPVSAWGGKSHLNEKWCEDCREKASRMGADWKHLRSDSYRAKG